MNVPLIDIVIPNRNKAPFLPATLASLAAQTETRWRAIVIDGESTDGSREILEEAARTDERISVRSARPTAKTGLSLYRAWNQGLLQVRAPYFAILTSDDLWEPKWLSRALLALESAPQAIAAAARAFLIDVDGRLLGPTDACRELESSFGLSGTGRRVLPSAGCCLRGLTLGPIFSSIHSLVFRRRVLEEGGLFAEDVGIAADIEYYLHACLLGDVVYDLDSRALFRIYPEQASSRASAAAVTRQWGKIVRRNQDYVAGFLGLAPADLAAAMTSILERHAFLMTKPARATFRRSKALAAWQLLQAATQSPRLFVEYLRCRSSFARFYAEPASRLTAELAAHLPPPLAPAQRPAG